MSAGKWTIALAVWTMIAAGVWAAEADFKTGDAIQVEKNGRWLGGKVLEKKGNQYLVRYDGLDAAFDELIPAAKVRVPLAQFAAGDAVEVQKETKWLKAKVLAVCAAEVQVHYEGTDAAFDEWIPAARVKAAAAPANPPTADVKPSATEVKPPAPAVKPPAPVVKPPAKVSLVVGAEVDVNWGGDWLPGKILEKTRAGWFRADVESDHGKISLTLPPDYFKARGTGKAAEEAERASAQAQVDAEKSAVEDVKLTPPDLSSVAEITAAPAAWTYAPPPPPATAVAAQGNTAIRLTGGTGGFSERPRVIGVRQARPAAVVVAYQSPRMGKLLRCPVQVIDIAAGKATLSFEPLAESEALTASPDGKWLLCQSDRFRPGTKDRLDLWSLEGAKARLEMSWRPFTGENLIQADVRSAHFIDERHVLTQCHDGKIVLWELPAAKAVYRLSGNMFHQLTLSPDGRTMVLDLKEGKGLFDVLTGKCLGMLPADLPPMARCAISPDGRRLAASDARRFLFFDLGTGNRVLEVGHDHLGDAVLWISDDLVLVGDKYLLDAKLGAIVWRVPLPPVPGTFDTNAMLGAGKFWLVVDEKVPLGQKKQYKLTGTALPLEQMRAAAARLKPETAYLLYPGSKVSIDFSQADVEAALRQQAIDSLTAQLKAQGVEVAAGQPVVITVSKKQLPAVSTTYRLRDGGETSASYIPSSYTLEMTLGGRLAWKAVEISAPPSMVVAVQGESIQGNVERSSKGADQFLIRVKIPKLIARPSDNPGFGETTVGN